MKTYSVKMVRSYTVDVIADTMDDAEEHAKLLAGNWSEHAQIDIVEVNEFTKDE